ncbi:MAG: sirohydrochlorin cobaltochelatase, partial [Desulfovibrionaceae bacterium]
PPPAGVAPRRAAAAPPAGAPAVAEVLARLRAEGCVRAVVQSLHVIPGHEYHGLLELANRLMTDPAGGWERIEVGFPLLFGEEGFRRTARALVRLGPPDRGPDEAVLFMGHGTLHPGNEAYEGLAEALAGLDGRVLVATMRGDPDLAATRARLRALGVRVVHLLPLLAVAGAHAEDDMAGEEEHAWAGLLSRDGIDCRAQLVGAVEQDALVDVWLRHLDDALARLARP